MPAPLEADVAVADMIDTVFTAYNARRLREASVLFASKMLQPEVTVGLAITGALTPAGYGISCLIPLIENGFVDWIVTTGANIYHDIHFGLGLPLHQGLPRQCDIELRKNGVVRIYDIVFDYEVLLDTDRFIRQAVSAEEFQKKMSSAELHALLGRYVAEREKATTNKNSTFIAACYRAGVPVYTSSPGDSSIGMNIAAAAFEGNALVVDCNLDVNETAAIVYAAKQVPQGKSAVMILGGGSPKNFVLQTEPHLQEVLGVSESGHDYFLQLTDARPDTGGLSGATPSEAVSWGKVDPRRLPDAVVAYCDVTIALPLLTVYALSRAAPRPLKRLFYRRKELSESLYNAYQKACLTAGKTAKGPHSLLR